MVFYSYFVFALCLFFRFREFFESTVTNEFYERRKNYAFTRKNVQQEDIQIFEHIKD